MQYISPIRYAFEFLLRNEFEGNSDAIITDPDRGRVEINPADDQLNFNLNQWIDIVVMVCMFFVLSLVALGFLKWQSKGIKN